MSIHLASVTLRGHDNTFPTIPRRDIHGNLYMEDAMLIFKGDAFALPMPLYQIKECYPFKMRADDLASRLASLATIFVLSDKAHFLIVTYYDANYDMDVTVGFFTAMNRPGENKADELTRIIWKYRGEAIKNLRNTTATVYRES